MKSSITISASTTPGTPALSNRLFFCCWSQPAAGPKQGTMPGSAAAPDRHSPTSQQPPPPPLLDLSLLLGASLSLRSLPLCSSPLFSCALLVAGLLLELLAPLALCALMLSGIILQHRWAHRWVSGRPKQDMACRGAKHMPACQRRAETQRKILLSSVLLRHGRAHYWGMRWAEAAMPCRVPGQMHACCLSSSDHRRNQFDPLRSCTAMQAGFRKTLSYV